MEMYRENWCCECCASWLFRCCECRLGYHKKPFLDGDSQCLGKTKEKAKEATPHSRLIPKFCLSLKPLKPLMFSFLSFFLSFLFFPSLIALLSILVLQLFKTNKTSCIFFFVFQARSQLLDGLPTKVCLPLRNHDMSWFKLLPRKVSWEAWGSLSALNWLYLESGRAYSAEIEAESSESRIMQGGLRIRSRRCARKGSCICCGITMKNKVASALSRTVRRTNGEHYTCGQRNDAKDVPSQ